VGESAASKLSITRTHGIGNREEACRVGGNRRGLGESAKEVPESEAMFSI